MIQRLLLLLCLALAAVASVQALNRTWVDVRPPQSQPGSEGWRSGPATSDCVRDPAGLSTPTRPDGGPANYLHTCGSRIYDAQGREVRITGLNWSGMESGDYVPGGLGERRWQEILDLIAALGYNTIRLPFSNEALEPGRKVKNVNHVLNPDLQDKTGLEVLDMLIAGARERGLKVILDRHRMTPSNWDPLWYSDEVPEDRWIADWRMLAARYAGDDTVVGVDLSNEPRNPATWGTEDPATDWRLAAERAGNYVLEVNPHLLILVEGIEDYDGSHYWWGGNLQGVRTAPVRLTVPNRVVYSPHDYGPAISDQLWFNAPGFPANLPDEWDRYWGYISREGIAPVVVGEFGGHSVGHDRDGQWQRALLAYIQNNELGALVWSLNPSWDTGGILAGDWRTVEALKQEAYRQILAPPLGVGAGGVFGRAPTRLSVVVRQEDTNRGNDLTLGFQIVNDGPDTLDLSRLELRYPLEADWSADPTQPPRVEAAEPVGGHTTVDLVPSPGNGQDGHLRIRFDPAARYVAPYQTSTKVTIHVSSSDSPTGAELGASSLGEMPSLGLRFGDEAPIALYLDGKLVWGREP